MFTRLLYFDKERVIEYNAIISNEDFVEFDQIDIMDSTEGKIVVPVLKDRIGLSIL